MKKGLWSALGGGAPRICAMGTCALVFVWGTSPSFAQTSFAQTSLPQKTQAENKNAMNRYLQGDYEKSFQEWILLARKGNRLAQYNIGILYLRGQGVTRDLQKAFFWLNESAKRNYPPSLYILGWFYEKGLLGQADSTRALGLYQKSARFHYQPAITQMSELLYRERDYKRAIDYLYRAANFGVARAYFLLGEIFAHGLGVPQNQKEALKWYQGASQLKDPDASYVLARFYIKNDEDKERGHALLRRAARGGNIAALNDLAWILVQNAQNLEDFEGLEDLDNLKQAYQLFMRAAKKGYAPSAVNLAALYSQGIGVALSYQNAFFWLEIASLLGQKNLQKSKAKFAYHLSQSDIDDVERNARAWFQQFKKARLLNARLFNSGVFDESTFDAELKNLTDAIRTEAQLARDATQ